MANVPESADYRVGLNRSEANLPRLDDSPVREDAIFSSCFPLASGDRTLKESLLAQLNVYRYILDEEKTTCVC